jgi:hypothetical protein
VYVNYGVPADYEELERRGIDVRGKIVIARYGGSWRGIKPKVAAEKGAIGAIIYSDPRDDGYFHGDTYPDGPFRPEHGVQRGSVMDMPTRPGDPLTPGYGATADAPRVSHEEAGTIMPIPVLPISYADAQPLLAAMGGPMAPVAWRGALPIPYRLGPGPARVHLRLEFDWDLAPAYNVVARLRGSELPDEWVIRGNHRDGWAMPAPSIPSAGWWRSWPRRAPSAARGIRLAAEAHARVRRLGRGGAGTARLHGVGRGSRRRAATSRRRLHQHGQQHARHPERRRLAHARALHQRGRARR